MFGQFWFAEQLGWPWWTPLAVSGAAVAVGLIAIFIYWLAVWK